MLIESSKNLLKAINAVSDEKQKSDLLQCFLDIADSIDSLKKELEFTIDYASMLKSEIQNLQEQLQIEHINKKE